MKFLIETVKFLVAAAIGAAVISIFKVDVSISKSFWSDPFAFELDYPDLAAIALSAASVGLGAVALVVAVAAVFGFQVIREASVQAAETRLKRDLPNMLKQELSRMEKDGRLTGALERALYGGGTGEQSATRSADSEGSTL